ncbi:MAG: lipopolysaccharide heptosyltransferase II [Epsilonproteobacteria bacterium]|nr:lipopolysaccharide heptosyltransferase II [Campylobacterota bacterium]
MKILVILPNWLGDAVMATPAIEMLAHKYPDVAFTFVGSFVSIEALKHHPKCKASFIDETKKSKKGRLRATLAFAKELGSFDIAITFRKQFHSSLLLKKVDAKSKIARSSWHAKLFGLTHTPNIPTNQHLVLQYASLAFGGEKAFSYDEVPPLKLYVLKKRFSRPTLGINAGATYGSAKRWYPDRFAEVGAYFSDKFDIIIFGGPNEVEMAKDIQEHLKQKGVKNFTNLAGKTTIEELCHYIGGCDLFITNDSGPMHVAAAYQVPTVAIFGPTKHTETSQWKNKKSIIVREDIECAPCMKRECPLKHHECMTKISAEMVIQNAKMLLSH